MLVGVSLDKFSSEKVEDEECTCRAADGQVFAVWTHGEFATPSNDREVRVLQVVHDFECTLLDHDDVVGPRSCHESVALWNEL